MLTNLSARDKIGYKSKRQVFLVVIVWTIQYKIILHININKSLLI